MSGLTIKQRLFVEAYLETLNATEAARRAGYKAKTYVTLRHIGSENLTKPNIKAEIDRRMRKASMSADEVLLRLTQQAQAPDMTEFIELRDQYEVDKDGNFLLTGKILDIDLNHIRELGLGHLIKSISQTTGGLKIEWYDAQGALEKLGKAHGLFKERVEHSGEIIQAQVNVYIPDNARGDRDPSPGGPAD
jgi:phage terminase small subunit